LPRGANKEYENSPRKAPRYNMPDRATGDVLLSSNLANGELKPNSTADITMQTNGLLFKQRSLRKSTIMFYLSPDQIQQPQITSVKY
jgi:hypothetical protein